MSRQGQEEFDKNFEALENKEQKEIVKWAKRELKLLKKHINGKGWYYILKKYKDTIAFGTHEIEQADMLFNYCGITINRHRNKAYIGYAWAFTYSNTELNV